MKEIKLLKGLVALVDDEDFERINAFKWSFHKEGRSEYAVSSIKIENKYKQFRMHRMILSISDPKVFVDHIDGNGLNNTKANLRLATHKQNSRNYSKLFSTNTSGFRGVRFDKRQKTKPWKCTIKFENKNVHLGYFISAEEAAKAFDKAAKELFGEFCGKLNYE